MSGKDFWEGYVPEPVKPAQCKYPKCSYPCTDLPDCRDAEQPAQQALDKKAENARELGLDYEPAQQEPVATDWERIARVQDAKLRAMCNESGGFEKLCEVMDRYEHTSPQPAQQEPVARQYQNRDGVWKDFISEKHYKDTLEDGSWPIRNLYTSAQRTWVGLTDEERKLVRNSVGYNQFVTAGEYAEHVQKATEFKLLEKNNG
jgi:hypothetical protein